MPHGEQSMDRLVEAAGDARIVLLGEASHGTSEFYATRAELSKRLILEKGFSIIAVEGDWPSAQEVNRFVKGRGPFRSAEDMLKDSFRRWLTWMWANPEVGRFAEWLKAENEKRAESQQVGFYGIDLYSLYESIDEVLRFLQENPAYGTDLELARKAFSCFEPYNRMPEHYALSTARFTDECISEVSDLLTSIRTREKQFDGDEEQDLDLKMNALVAKNAETYYRTMMLDDAGSWNIRDTHMTEAIGELLDYHGEEAKIIVWEHNTHIGDASETSMANDGMINVGQLIRERYGKDGTFAVGFGTYEGTVIAAENWGDPWERMTVPPAKLRTWEGQLQGAVGEDLILLFTEENRGLFSEWTGHRAIGVVYNPEFEAYGNFVSSRVGRRYDAFIFFSQSTALDPY